MKNLKLLILLTLIFAACSPIKYHTIYQGSYDPAYDLKGKKVCFFPWYWTDYGKKNNIDQLVEKTLFYHFKNELGKRGLTVEYIEPSNLIYDSEKNTITTAVYKPCDLSLSIFYSQNMGSVKVPAQSAGSLWVNPNYGFGSYGSVGSYDINYYNLFISSGLFLGKSADLKKVWSASITKGSPKPDLEEQSAEMVKNLINKKFPK
jgi:hypothetical protein